MKKIYCLLLVLLMALLFCMGGCNGKKTISPPTITGIRQEGLDVYIEYEPLYNSLSPEFSLDGTNWYFPSNCENNSICIFTYNLDTQMFVSMGNQISVAAGEITVYIREVEGPDTLASSASNGYTYTLVVPKIG